MGGLADAGMAVLFTSSELAEVIAMSDRVLVMARRPDHADWRPQRYQEQQLVTASSAGAW